MTWSERLKSAWTTFKREALPLYGWTIIFIGTMVVLLLVMTLGFLEHFRWTFPNIHNFQGAYSYSTGMPVPGVPPEITPFDNSFTSPMEDPFAFFGGIHDYSRFLPIIGRIAGAFFLISLVIWLIGSAFWTGIINLTRKAYREKVSFKDFRLRGFFRILGWQAFIFLIQLIILAPGLTAVIALRELENALVAFFISYGLFLLVIGLYTLPWITSSGIYLLAHPELTFPSALRESWRFFRRNMGILWGYLGTVILIQIAIEILNRLSQGLAGIAYLVIGPYTVVLAIIWVLSIEDDERDRAWIVSRNYVSPVSNPQQQPINNTPPSSDLKGVDASESSPPEPKINLQKQEPLPSFSEDKPPFCSSCGKTDTGTAYCPQCGTKLR